MNYVNSPMRQEEKREREQGEGKEREKKEKRKKIVLEGELYTDEFLSTKHFDGVQQQTCKGNALKHCLKPLDSQMCIKHCLCASIRILLRTHVHCTKELVMIIITSLIALLDIANVSASRLKFTVCYNITDSINK